MTEKAPYVGAIVIYHAADGEIGNARIFPAIVTAIAGTADRPTCDLTVFPPGAQPFTRSRVRTVAEWEAQRSAEEEAAAEHEAWRKRRELGSAPDRPPRLAFVAGDHGRWAWPQAAG